MSIDFSARQPLTGVMELLSHRWSPRAFEKTNLSPEQVAVLIDAARFAPSCNNEQPWRFYTSHSQTFAEYLALLVEGNRAWAKDAALLGFVVTKKYFVRNGKPNNFADFDAGAAWLSLALQAQHMGFYAHGMGGFDGEAASQYLQLDLEQEHITCAFAVGKLGNLDLLDDEAKKRNTPNARKALDEIWIGR